MASSFPADPSCAARSARVSRPPANTRTAHDVTLWPLQIFEAEYLSSASAVANLGVPSRPGLKAGLRLRLRSTAGLQFSHLALDSLAVFLRGRRGRRPGV